MDNLQNKNITANLKILILGVASLICLAIDWFLIRQALYSDKPLLYWVWPFIATAIVIALMTLFATVNNNRIYAAGFAALATASYLLIFPKDPFVILGGAVFLVLLYWFEQRLREEEISRQDFSIRRVSQAGNSVILYAFLLSLCFNIYYNTSADFKANPEGFYDVLGRSAAKSTRYLTGQDSGIDLNQTLEQYLETEAKNQTPNFNQMPQSFQQQYVQDAKEQFFRQFNINIPSNLPLSEIISSFAVERVRSSAEKVKVWFPLIFTLIILALLRTFSFLLRWVSMLLTWLIFKFLLYLRFLRLEKVNVEVEKLVI